MYRCNRADFDTIMFLYRDEIYNNDTDRKGIAEVIVPKCYCRYIADIWLLFIPSMCMFLNTEDGIKSFEIEISRPDTEYMDSEKRIPYLGYREFEKNILKAYLERGYDLVDETVYGIGKCNTRKYTFGKVKKGVWKTYNTEIKVVKADAKKLMIKFWGEKYNSYGHVLHKIIDVLER